MSRKFPRGKLRLDVLSLRFLDPSLLNLNLSSLQSLTKVQSVEKINHLSQMSSSISVLRAARRNSFSLRKPKFYSWLFYTDSLISSTLGEVGAP